MTHNSRIIKVFLCRYPLMQKGYIFLIGEGICVLLGVLSGNEMLFVFIEDLSYKNSNIDEV